MPRYRDLTNVKQLSKRMKCMHMHLCPVAIGGGGGSCVPPNMRMFSDCMSIRILPSDFPFAHHHLPVGLSPPPRGGRSSFWGCLCGPFPSNAPLGAPPPPSPAPAFAPLRLPTILSLLPTDPSSSQ